ncbi:hypothetical protein MWN34_10675 [Ancylobacter sp. 6x-1]|uniref:DUF736 domain-containing protein n=1 Tax=Ancylobacter crimeensis TaxID=2579147 RepID=A0ABT0DBN8_9HYPH|nr:hypothetical protein [Ancylobacter crimeensis]MCK0197376.1 hypothetical protein [Ancylobacter crimeensis]
MAYNRNTQTRQQAESKQAEGRPVYLNALVGREGKDDKVHWKTIGAAFPAKSGEGWDLVLDALPIDGRIYLRTPTAKSEA